MSMDKAIEHGKEHRKPYRRAQAVDTTCRNHGSCIYCQRNRMHRTIRELERTDEEMREAEAEIREKALSAVKKLGKESEKNFPARIKAKGVSHRQRPICLSQSHPCVGE